jgi:alpha-mannosidase
LPTAKDSRIFGRGDDDSDADSTKEAARIWTEGKVVSMMESGMAAPDEVVDAALGRLRAAADLVGSGWSPTRWSITDAGEPDRSWDNEASADSIGALIHGLGDLDLDANKHPLLRTVLDVPSRLHGIELEGDRLELTVWSVYPLTITVDGRPLFDESIPPVALGPALIDVVERIGSAPPAEFAARVQPNEGQRGGALTWLDFRFTTPGLRARFELLDLAWAGLFLASELAVTPVERDAVRAAATIVATVDLEGEGLERDLAAMADALSPLADRVAQIEVHVIGHSHVDLAWLWTWDDAREVIKRDVRSVLAIMGDYPEVTFTHSQPAGYEVVRLEEPELFADIVRLVGEGRWEPATAQWVEGDTNLAGGEAMASQLLEGVTFSRRHLGVSPRLFFAPDTFGHSANMPQLVAEAGVDVYLHARCNPGDRDGERWPAYWWEAPDGTRVLACSPDGYNGTLTAGEIARAALRAHRAGLRAALLFVGVGDHGGGPTRHGYDTLRRIGQVAGMPRARCSTVSAYADDVRSMRVRLPVHRGESTTIFEGCYTSHADAKAANRSGENRLATAEALAAMAGLGRQEELDEAWRRLCFHQFHDVVGGAAVNEVYRHAAADHATIADVASTVTARAIGALAAGSDAGSIVVANPNGHRCTDVAVVAGVPSVRRPVLVDERGGRTAGQFTGDQLVFVADVPGFGVTRYQLVDAVDGEDVVEGPSVTGSADGDRYFTVESSAFRVAVRKDCGVITSFVDKRCDRELVAFGMRRATDYLDAARPDLGLNILQLVDELPHFMSAWHFLEPHAEHSLLAGATTTLVEHGPVRVVLRVVHEPRSSRIVEDLVFYRDIPRVDLLLRIDWQEPGGSDHGVPNLELAFVPDLDQPAAWFEVPHAAVRRRANGQRVPALRWVDLGEEEDYGVAVLNDAVYGHDVLGTRIRLALVRTSYLPDPRSDHGEYEFRVGLVPHEGNWRAAAVPQLAASFNQPLVAAPVDVSGTAPAGGDRTTPTVETRFGLALASLRVARDGSSIVVRLVEMAGEGAGVTIGGVPAASSAWTSNLVEDRVASLDCDEDGILVELRPWETRTVLISHAFPAG